MRSFCDALDQQLLVEVDFAFPENNAWDRAFLDNFCLEARAFRKEHAYHPSCSWADLESLQSGGDGQRTVFQDDVLLAVDVLVDDVDPEAGCTGRSNRLADGCLGLSWCRLSVNDTGH